MTDANHATRHLFLGGVAYRATEHDIRAAIEAEGITVGSIRLGIDHDTGRSRGFAFVDVDDARPLVDLITMLTGVLICDRACRVEMVNEKPPRSDRASSGHRPTQGTRAPEPRNDVDSRQQRRRKERYERPWRDGD